MSTPYNSSAPANTTSMFDLEGMSNATHGNAKALFGILFIQYCSYAFFYIMDHLNEIYPAHYTELKRKDRPEQQQEPQQEDPNAGDDDGQEEGEEEEEEQEEEEMEEPNVAPNSQKKQNRQQQPASNPQSQKHLQQQQLQQQQQMKANQQRSQKYQQNVEIEQIDENEDDSDDDGHHVEGGDSEDDGGRGRRQQSRGSSKQKQQQQQRQSRRRQQDFSDEFDDQDEAGRREQIEKRKKQIQDSMKQSITNKYEYAFAKALSNKVKDKAKLPDLDEDEEAAYEEWEKRRLQSISNQIVEYFPQIMIWHTMIVSMCAIRSPVDFAVSCTLFAMLMRIVMVFGYYCNKKMVYVAASGLEIFCNFCILFIAMGYSQYN